MSQVLVERPVKLLNAPLFLFQFYSNVCATSVMDSDHHPRLKLFLHELLFNFGGVIEGSDVVDIIFALDGNRLGSHCDHVSFKTIRWRLMSGKKCLGGDSQESRKQKEANKVKRYSTTGDRRCPIRGQPSTTKISLVLERHRPSIDFLLVNTDFERF